jgi:hypothetical protein
VYQEVFSNSNLKRKILIPDTTLDTTRHILWILCAVVGCWKLGPLLRPDKSDANPKHSFTLLSFTANPNPKHSFTPCWCSRPSSPSPDTRAWVAGGYRLQLSSSLGNITVITRPLDTQSAAGYPAPLPMVLLLLFHVFFLSSC